MALIARSSCFRWRCSFARVSRRNHRRFSRGQQEGLGAVNSYVEEHYAGHDVLKLYGGEDRAEHEFDEMNDTLNEDARRAQFALPS